MNTTEWIKTILGEVADIQTGPFGSQLHNEDYVAEGTPIITVEHLVNDFISHSETIPKVSDEDAVRLGERYTLQSGDIVFSRVGSVDRSAYVNETENGWLFSGRLLRVRHKQGVDSRWLHYWLTQPITKEYVRKVAVGATMPSINTAILSGVPVSLPPQEIQISVAAVLSSLDDKIELLRAENETLEAIAQEIFNEWFVKPAAGGVLPEGWRTVPLNSLFTFEGGAQPPKSEHIYEPRDGYVRFIQNRDYSTDAHPTYIRESYKNRLCDELDIMMDKYGEVGTVRYGIVGAYNVALAKIEPSTPNTREYLRSFFSQTHIRELLDASAVASTRGSLNKTTFAGLDIPLPTAKTLENYENTALLLRRQVLYNRAQSRHLAIVCDTLLPKLMSGQIRV